jgi:hypothetical protein
MTTKMRTLVTPLLAAIAVLAGCSSPSLPTSTNTNSPAGHLTGTMSDLSDVSAARGDGYQIRVTA